MCLYDNSDKNLSMNDLDSNELMEEESRSNEKVMREAYPLNLLLKNLTG